MKVAAAAARDRTETTTVATVTVRRAVTVTSEAFGRRSRGRRRGFFLSRRLHSARASRAQSAVTATITSNGKRTRL